MFHQPRTMMSGNNGNKNRSGEIGLGRDEFFFFDCIPAEIGLVGYNTQKLFGGKSKDFRC